MSLICIAAARAAHDPVLARGDGRGAGRDWGRSRARSGSSSPTVGASARKAPPSAHHALQLSPGWRSVQHGSGRDARDGRLRRPRAPCSNGTSRRATQSPSTRRSSRSPPTRSTPRFPRRPPATVVKIHAAEGETVVVGACWPRSPPTRRRTRRRRPPNPVGECRTRIHRAGCRRRGHRGRGRGHRRRRRDDGHRHAHRRRVGDRGHDPRVVGQGRGQGQGRRHRRRDLDRQGRHGASRARRPARSPRSSRGRRDGDRGPGDRPDERRGRELPNPRLLPHPKQGHGGGRHRQTRAGERRMAPPTHLRWLAASPPARASTSLRPGHGPRRPDHQGRRARGGRQRCECHTAG